MLTSKEKHTDKELITLFASGQKEHAFNLIMKKYQERLYWHIRKIIITHEDTDDILQNTFIKVWKGLEGFRSDSHLFTWLYRIATNEALSFLKTKKRRILLPIDGNEYNLSELLISDTYFCGNEAQRKLQNALLQLPEKQRLVFNMKYFDEMKYESISAIVGTSVGALKASYHHAVKKIENILNRE